MNINNLKTARENVGLTQSQVAEKLGISDGTYKNYEQGKREPNNALLVKIADLYGVSTDYLLGREKPTTKPDVLTMLTQEFHLTELERVLVQAYIAISPKEREKFVQFIEETVKQKEETQRQQQLQEPEPSSKPDIQISQADSELAIARGGTGYKPAPTDEQFSKFVELTPDMLGEELP